MKLLAICVLASGLLASDADDKLKKDRAAAQGVWTAELVEANGAKPEEAQNLVVTVKDDKISFKLKDKQFAVATLKLDPTVDPKLIDLTFTEGDSKGLTWEGIYVLEGDSFKFCIGLIEKQRPSEFATKVDSNSALVVLKREKQ